MQDKDKQSTVLQSVTQESPPENNQERLEGKHSNSPLSCEVLHESRSDVVKSDTREPSPCNNTVKTQKLVSLVFGMELYEIAMLKREGYLTVHMR